MRPENLSQIIIYQDVIYGTVIDFAEDYMSSKSMGISKYIAKKKVLINDRPPEHKNKHFSKLNFVIRHFLFEVY